MISEVLTTVSLCQIDLAIVLHYLKSIFERVLNRFFEGLGRTAVAFSVVRFGPDKFEKLRFFYEKCAFHVQKRVFGPQNHVIRLGYIPRLIPARISPDGQRQTTSKKLIRITVIPRF